MSTSKGNPHIQLTEGFGNHLSLGLRQSPPLSLSCFVFGGPYEEQCESVAGRLLSPCGQRVMGSRVVHVGLEKQ